MSQHARRYLVAYDISDDRRRTRIAKILEAYGERLQYSVFLVELGGARYVRLTRALIDSLDGADSVLVCDLGPLQRSGPAGGALTFLGRPHQLLVDGELIV